MSQVPSDFYNDRKFGTEEISNNSKKQLIGLGYENWLGVQQSQGGYNAPISHYHPSTVKEFLIYYRESEQKKWDIARYGSKNQVSEFGFLGQGYEADDGNTLAKNNILSGFVNYTNSNIKEFNNTQLESFISRVYADKNRTFNDVNKDTSHRVSLPLRVSYGLLSIILSPFSFLSKGNEENGPLREAPIASRDTQSFKRTQSMPGGFNYKSHSHPGAGSGKRKRSNPDQDPAQKYLRITRSNSDSYFQAYESRDKKQLERAEDLRRLHHEQEEERREAERRKMEEKTKQKAEKQGKSRPLPPASNLPSQSTSQIQKSLFGSDGRLQRASTMQSSPLSRINSQQPRRNGGVPGSAPGQPLNARQANSSMRTGGPRRY